MCSTVLLFGLLLFISNFAPLVAAEEICSGEVMSWTPRDDACSMLLTVDMSFCQFSMAPEHITASLYSGTGDTDVASSTGVNSHLNVTATSFQIVVSFRPWNCTTAPHLDQDWRVQWTAYPNEAVGGLGDYCLGTISSVDIVGTYSSCTIVYQFSTTACGLASLGGRTMSLGLRGDVNSVGVGVDSIYEISSDPSLLNFYIAYEPWLCSTTYPFVDDSPQYQQQWNLTFAITLNDPPDNVRCGGSLGSEAWQPLPSDNCENPRGAIAILPSECSGRTFTQVTAVFRGYQGLFLSVSSNTFKVDSETPTQLMFFDNYSPWACSEGVVGYGVDWSITAGPRAQERDALVALYMATDGDNWTNNASWLQGNPCSWFGVLCDRGTTVTEIRLSRNNLFGSIPEEIAGLSGLRNLILNANILSGTIPWQSSATPSNVISASSRGVQVYGRTSLLYSTLAVRHPEFLGSVNRTQTPVPVLCGMSSLRILDLSNNQLSGDVADCLSSLTSLVQLYLSANGLSGELPPSLYSTPLVSLHLGANFFESQDLSHFCQMQSLLDLSLNKNPFVTATVPSCFGSLQALESLDLSQCNITGTLPESLGNMTLLSYLALNGNKQLAGTIPATLTSCFNLETLLLQYCSLYGHVPAGLGDLPELTTCDLSGQSGITCPVPDVCCSDCVLSPADCPAGSFCPGKEPIKCDPGYYCPAGTPIETLCPLGYYCPSPIEKISCPAGHFCLNGTVTPHKCLRPYVWLCHSDRQYYMGAVILAGAAVFSTLFMMLFGALGPLQPILSCAFPFVHEWSRAEDEEYLIAPEERLQALGPHGAVTFKYAFDAVSSERLKSLTCLLESSKVTAIMGESGAGKSSAAAAMLGKHKLLTGTVNGRRESPLRGVERYVASIPQFNEALPDHVTLWELVTLRSYERGSNFPSWRDSKQLANLLLVKLNLYEHRHTLVKDLSGGQAKRAFIAAELATQPKIVILDEPTSGLDVRSARDAIKFLHAISRSWHSCVIAILHGPPEQSLLFVDNFLFLKPASGKKGFSMWFWARSRLYQWWAEYKLFKERLVPGNEPEHGQLREEYQQELADIEGDLKPGQELEDNYDDNCSGNPTDDALEALAQDLTGEDSMCGNFNEDDFLDAEWEQTDSKPVFAITRLWRKLSITFLRSQITDFRNILGFLIHYGFHIMAGLLAGLASYSQQYVGPLPPHVQDCCCAAAALGSLCTAPVADPLILNGFLLVLGTSLAAIASSTSTFSGRAFTAFEHDRQTASSFVDVFGYWLGRVLNDFLFRNILAPCLIVGLYYSLAIVTGRFWVYLLLCCFVEWTSYALGYCVSAVIPKTNPALGGVIVIFLFSVISGVSPSLNWVADLSPLVAFPWKLSFVRWAVEAFYNEEVRYYSEVFDVDAGLEQYGFTDSTAWSMACLALLGLTFYVVSFLLLFFAIERRLSSAWSALKSALKSAQSCVFGRCTREPEADDVHANAPVQMPPVAGDDHDV